VLNLIFFEQVWRSRNPRRATAPPSAATQLEENVLFVWIKALRLGPLFEFRVEPLHWQQCFGTDRKQGRRLTARGQLALVTECDGVKTNAFSGDKLALDERGRL
jgi:hypothetical protein